MLITSVEWRELLSLRSIRNKFAVAVEGRPKRIVIALRQLREKGYIVWLDNDYVPIGGLKIKCDLYLLTPKGSKLCDDNSIEKR
jgi:hypothetical protein